MPGLSRDLAALIAREEAAHGIPRGLLFGLLQHESEFNAGDVGIDRGSVDRGIAQINSAAHPNVTPAEAFDPAFAVPWAAEYLAQLRRSCGSWAGALAAYNSGSCAPGGDLAYVRAVAQDAARYGGIPVEQEVLGMTAAVGGGRSKRARSAVDLAVARSNHAAVNASLPEGFRFTTTDWVIVGAILLLLLIVALA